MTKKQSQLVFLMFVAVAYVSTYAKPPEKPAAVAKAAKHRAPAPAKVGP